MVIRGDDSKGSNHAFIKDAMTRAAKTNLRWYHKRLMRVLERAKECNAREIDEAIALAKQLKKMMDEKVKPPVIVPPREVVPIDNADTMKPVDPKVYNAFYESSEKGGDERYLHARYKIPPEDRFYFRVTSNFDYGWQQRLSRVPARDVFRGKCKILKETFYRNNNAGPDPPHYKEPAGGVVSICSEYACIP